MDIAISIFKLSNRRGLFVPGMNIQYAERDSNIVWNLVGGGARADVVRFGSPLLDDPTEQSADSRFMVRRVTSALVKKGREWSENGLIRTEQNCSRQPSSLADGSIRGGPSIPVLGET